MKRLIPTIYTIMYIAESKTRRRLHAQQPIEFTVLKRHIIPISVSLTSGTRNSVMKGKNGYNIVMENAIPNCAERWQ